MLPCLLPLFFHGIRFTAFPLNAEALQESKLRPPVPWILHQIRAVDYFRLAGLTGSQQGSAEIVAGRNRPERRFGVW